MLVQRLRIKEQQSRVKARRIPYVSKMTFPPPQRNDVAPRRASQLEMFECCKLCPAS